MNVEEQGGRSFRIPARPAPAEGAPPDAGCAKGNESLEQNQAVLIRPGQWTRVWAAWLPAAGSPARVTEVIASFGAHAALVWSLGNFPPGDSSLFITQCPCQLTLSCT